ncbi:hypothetical protein K488DRAFT_69563 [Vararia minispora EC-137]|uniref:Uncharacterized protein n=1 Tax=Vararia minispora EC-137 TaxID=1314806 RepID=A0ACB8QR98_9AGAM|nr:hypothetical protein K488DRAFT_69563 [Vararia minispora EC-137]
MTKILEQEGLAPPLLQQHAVSMDSITIQQSSSPASTLTSPPSAHVEVLHSRSSPVRKEGKFQHLSRENFHALLIGIDKYANYGSLKGAIRDVESMHDFLIGAFDVQAPSSIDLRILKNEQATSARIIEAIAKLKDDKKVKQTDVILIYFAGHGATMPPPKGWPGWAPTPPLGGWTEDVEIQCIVAHDAAVSMVAPSKYSAGGVIPDRTLNVLLRELADAKGNNITVILDCCHSSSGTRSADDGPEELNRKVDLKDPMGNRATIPEGYDRRIWGPYFCRGAVLDWEYRHAGLGSHVLIAACGRKEQAADGLSFTQALLELLKQRFLDALSYTLLIKSIKNLGKRRAPQNPLCEGNSVQSMLFDIKDVHLGRLTFDVVQEGHYIVLTAGEMLGVTPQMQFDVYTSKAISLYEECIGKFKVERVGSTSSHLKDIKTNLDGAVASPSFASSDTFYVHVPNSTLRATIETAVSEESSEDRFGRSRIDTSGTASGSDLTLSTDGTNVCFLYQRSSNISQLGLERLIFTFPSDAWRIRRVLRSGAHFFKFLQHEAPHGGVRLRDYVEVRLWELEETNDFTVGVDGKLKRVLEHKHARPLERAASGAYEVLAATAGTYKEGARRYGIELMNRLQKDGLFVWAFLFDCSTLEIRQYHEPRVARGNSSIDPTLPCVATNPQPVPIALNYRNGAGRVLRLQLQEGQTFDIGFLRIFLSTRYRGGALTSIMQHTPLVLKDGVWRGARRERLRGALPPSMLPRPTDSANDVPDLWDVLTIPLVQRAE